MYVDSLACLTFWKLKLSAYVAQSYLLVWLVACYQLALDSLLVGIWTWDTILRLNSLSQHIKARRSPCWVALDSETLSPLPTVALGRSQVNLQAPIIIWTVKHRKVTGNYFTQWKKEMIKSVSNMPTRKANDSICHIRDVFKKKSDLFEKTCGNLLFHNLCVWGGN